MGKVDDLSDEDEVISARVVGMVSALKVCAAAVNDGCAIDAGVHIDAGERLGIASGETLREIFLL